METTDQNNDKTQDQDNDTTPSCAWCNDTGTYSGPVLNLRYAGPCLMCTE